MQKSFRLTPRLQAVAEEIAPDARVADIGTDHARLPVWLVQNGVSPRCYAADVREGPLSRARETIAAAGLAERIEAVLSDGLACVPLTEVDAVVFAGMGGELIAQLMAAAPDARDPRLQFVFQPMTAVPELRRWLASAGFSLLRERLVGEGDRLYIIMTARYTGAPYELSPFASEVGGLPAAHDPLWPEFARRLAKRMRIRCGGLRRGGREREAEEVDKLLAELYQQEGSPMPIVNDVIAMFENAAPLRLALPDDNPGLLCGDRTNEVTRAVVTLDITDAAVDAAVASGAELIVSHHPVIFTPRRSVTADDADGARLLRMARHGISALCLHTNMDVAPGGIADIDAGLLGLTDTAVLSPTKTEKYYKLVTFAPYYMRPRLIEKLGEAGAGRYANYAECAFETTGRGTFVPLSGAKPFLGEVGRREWADEMRLEMIVPEGRADAVVRALRENHPYEEPAYDLLATDAPRDVYGLGRVGKLPETMEPETFGQHVKSVFGCEAIRMKGGGRPIRTAAVLPGSGGSYIADALRAGADALVTGDVKHHQFIEAAAAGLTLIDAGHCETELPLCGYFAELLEKYFPGVEVIRSDAHASRPDVL